MVVLVLLTKLAWVKISDYILFITNNFLYWSRYDLEKEKIRNPWGSCGNVQIQPLLRMCRLAPVYIVVAMRTRIMETQETKMANTKPSQQERI